MYNRGATASITFEAVKMIIQATQQLQRFISDNSLKREDGIIVFDAFITLYKKEIPIVLESEVQVITLPAEMVIYLLEFCKPEQTEKEMYRTSQHQFFILPRKELEITDTESNSRLIISLKRNLPV